MITIGPMHRISLKGPWNLSIIGQQLRSSRKFHAPTGVRVLDDSPAKLKQGLTRTFLVIQLDTNWAEFLACLNGEKINPTIAERSSDPNKPPASLVGTYKFEMTAIIQRFNEVVLTWNACPMDFKLSSGSYSPSPSHPFHFDSWLEIIEA